MKIIGSLLPRLIKKYKGQSKPKAEALPTKLTFIPKSKTFKINPKHTRLHGDPIAKRDMASAIARRSETRSHIALTKKVEDAYKRTIAKPQKANQLAILKAKKTRALTKAFTLSQKRGMKTLEKTSKKLDVNIKRFGSQRSKSYAGISPSEARHLGFPPKEVSSEMKAFYAKGQPIVKLKKIRSGLGTKTFGARTTLDKIYAMPKSAKKSRIKSLWRAKAKGEIKAAKLDRLARQYQTVEKQVGKNWRTISRFESGNLTKFNIKLPPKKRR